jgi:hypothetical protein
MRTYFVAGQALANTRQELKLGKIAVIERLQGTALGGELLAVEGRAVIQGWLDLVISARLGKHAAVADQDDALVG